MTVVSPDTPEESVSGLSYPFDENNLADGRGPPVNTNDCPNNGTAALPANGVVFVENATTAQAWANPFDDAIDNSVTNLTEPDSSPTSGESVRLTATVTSDSSQLNSGAAVSFSRDHEQRPRVWQPDVADQRTARPRHSPRRRR